MPRTAVQENERVALRIRPEDKAMLLRAVAIMQTDMTGFILQTALREARTVIDQYERIRLSEKASLMVLDLLENPPPVNERLRRAAKHLPKMS